MGGGGGWGSQPAGGDGAVVVAGERGVLYQADDKGDGNVTNHS